MYIYTICQHTICTHVRYISTTCTYTFYVSTHNMYTSTRHVNTQSSRMYAICWHTICTHVCCMFAHIVYACMLYANTQYVNMHTMCQHDIGTYVVYVSVYTAQHIYIQHRYMLCIYTHLYIVFLICSNAPDMYLLLHTCVYVTM